MAIAHEGSDGVTRNTRDAFAQGFANTLLMYRIWPKGLDLTETTHRPVIAEFVAISAYELADAMLLVREKGPSRRRDGEQK